MFYKSIKVKNDFMEVLENSYNQHDKNIIQILELVSFLYNVSMINYCKLEVLTAKATGVLAQIIKFRNGDYYGKRYKIGRKC